MFNVGAGDVDTLIADINAANSNGQSNVINLTASTYDLTTVNNFWYGPNGLPAISSNLTIHGNGAVIQRDPYIFTPYFRLFYVSGGLELAPGSLTMDNVTLEGGVAKGGDSNYGGGLGAGGAIFNQGTLNLTDVTLTDNQAVGGRSGVVTAGDGGGGMGGDAPSNGDGGDFGGDLSTNLGGSGGSGSTSGGGGGGGGFLTGAKGANGSGTSGGAGGGLSDFGGAGGGAAEDGGGGGGGGIPDGGTGSNFGEGGLTASTGGGGAGTSTTGGGGGGFGGGGGAGGGKGGFGGGDGQNFYAGSNGDGDGGAIFNMGADSAHAGSGQATLINCTLTDNTAQSCALYNLDGTVNLTNDTIVNNPYRFMGAIPPGGAPAQVSVNVLNQAFGNDIDTGEPVRATRIINNSILAHFNPYFFGGGGAVDLTSYASGANTATVSGSHNLITNSDNYGQADFIISWADPMLGPLQNNGGLTPTMMPLPGSPVLSAGDPSLAPATDQRGVPRPANGPIDLGAVQVSVTSTSGPTTGSPPSLLEAVFALFLDGAFEEVDSLANAGEFFSSTGFSQTPEGEKAIFLTEWFMQFPPFNSPLSGPSANININLQYAGPFGPLR